MMRVQYLDPQSALEFGVFVVFLVPGGGGGVLRSV